MIKNLFVTFLLGWAMTAQAETKIVNIGAMTSPTAIWVQSYQRNLKLPNTFVTAKDCGSAKKIVETMPNSAFLLDVNLAATAVKQKDQCWNDFDPKKIIIASEGYFDVCRLPDNNTTLLTPGVKLGRASVQPVKEWEKDFNSRNNASVKSVPLLGSKNVLQALLTRDIDWGIIAKEISQPMVKTGQIVCPFDTNAKSPAGLNKTYKLKLENFFIFYLLVANTDDPAILTDLRQAARSPQFQEFLAKSHQVNIRTEVTQRDVDYYKETLANILGLLD